MKNNNFSITTHKLAKICSVSQGTVDRALNNRSGISLETKERILAAAKKYGYIDNFDEKRRLIGIVIFDLYNEYFSELVMHLEESCRKRVCSLVVMFTDKDGEKEQKCIKQLYYMGVCGIVLCPINKGEDFENFLKSYNIPIVTTGNRLNGIPYVGINNFKAMYDACKIFSKENKRILYYGPRLFEQENNYAQSERLKGFEACAKDQEIEYKIVSEFDMLEEVLTSEKGWAVMCSTDYYMQKVAARFPGIKAMGFDNTRVRKIFADKYHSVDTSSDEVSEKALDIIENRLEEDCIVHHTIV